MPYSRPTLADIKRQVAADIDAELDGVDALLRYSNLAIMGTVQARLANDQFGYLDWIARQSNPFTATGEFLEAWAALKGVFRKPATAATGTVSFASALGTVPSGSPINRSDGTAYGSTIDATAAAGLLTVPVQAKGTGASTNAAAGTGMTLGVGIAGVPVSGVAGPLTGGADIELDSDLRTRMLQAYAQPPQGGSISDYANWAEAVPGVTRAWIKPSAMGPGTVGIYFMMDLAEAAFRGFPQGSNGCSQYETRGTVATGDQLAVADAVFGQQSVTALIYAIAPTRNQVDITIDGLGTPGPGAQAAIATAIDAALFIGAVPGGRTNLSAIEAAIARVGGTDGFVITAIAASAGTITPGAAGNIISNAGALPVRGNVIYTP